MRLRWKLKKQPDPQTVNTLSEAIKCRIPLAKLFVQRGIETYDTAKHFFNPSLDDLHDPWLMKGMDIAVERINHALTSQQNILVYGDYDVDGTTSATLLLSYLRELSYYFEYKGNLDYYIPDRHKEGYGLSAEGVKYAVDNGFQLVITVDCGIKAVEKIAMGREHGVDFIVCDHHLPGETLPMAITILDPQQKDCPYPYKYLSGCGVAFKLIQALQISNKLPAENVYEYLDLVAVSIASDIVPLTGENRILAYHGLIKLNANPRQGLAAIIKIAGIKSKIIHIDSVVFKIGPRINAAGRIKSGKTAVELLLTGNEELAKDISIEINELNNDRRSLDKQTTEEALMQIESIPNHTERYSTVVYNEHWHKGVIGIVASRLIESHYKPTIVITRSNGLLTGSGRSVDGFDLYTAIEHCGHYLERYGGHFHAAGINLKPENLDAFSAAFEDYVSKNISEEQRIPSLDIDIELQLSDIDEKFYTNLKRFEPFGPENMTPVFMTRGLRHNGTFKFMANGTDHVRMDVFDENGQRFTAVGFFVGEMGPKIQKAEVFDLCYSIDMNEYNGRKSLQLVIRDVMVDH